MWFKYVTVSDAETLADRRGRKRRAHRAGLWPRSQGSGCGHASRDGVPRSVGQAARRPPRSVGADTTRRSRTRKHFFTNLFSGSRGRAPRGGAIESREGEGALQAELRPSPCGALDAPAESFVRTCLRGREKGAPRGSRSSPRPLGHAQEVMTIETDSMDSSRSGGPTSRAEARAGLRPREVQRHVLQVNGGSRQATGAVAGRSRARRGTFPASRSGSGRRGRPPRHRRTSRHALRELAHEVLDQRRECPHGRVAEGRHVDRPTRQPIVEDHPENRARAPSPEVRLWTPGDPHVDLHRSARRPGSRARRSAARAKLRWRSRRRCRSVRNTVPPLREPRNGRLARVRAREAPLVAEELGLDQVSECRR